MLTGAADRSDTGSIAPPRCIELQPSSLLPVACPLVPDLMHSSVARFSSNVT